MLEIYNETIRDLLSTNRTSTMELVRADNSTSGKQYAITHDVNGNTHVSDLTIFDVSSIGKISSLLQQAAQSRFCLGTFIMISGLFLLIHHHVSNALAIENSNIFL